ncbi:MAG: hypothetical protein VX153_02815 [Verrucomicrobiota bacterium]|nr:hypothetical protein [Verrucomicrobiota bacterium]
MSEKIEAFIEKLKQNPQNRFHRFNLAQAYFDDGSFELAKKEFMECLKIADDWMMALLYAGKSCLEIGETDIAQKYFKETIIAAKEQGHDDPMLEAESLLQQCKPSQ